MKIKAIIQARTSSTRLPRKVLLTIMGKTILEYVIERTINAKNIAGAIIATTTNKEDAHIADIAKKSGVEVYRGSEDDVLDRFYNAAKAFDAAHIARITADCPLIDPRLIDCVIDYYFKSKADYCSNVLDPTFPDGEDIEVFSFKALSEAWKSAELSSEREHVTPYIIKHPDRFRLVSFKNNIDISNKRWTLDEEKDFKFIKSVLEALYPGNHIFTIEDILEFIRKNADAEKLNMGIRRNEGYKKSLKEDRMIK